VPRKQSLTDAQIRLIGKALADPRRHEILKQIASRKDSIPCADVRERQTISAATLSHHLKELERAGLISVERRGKFADLSIRREMLDAYRRYLKTL
jgi:DNA-binding transcriptional ArsR family regulator